MLVADRIRLNIAELGGANRAELYHAVGIANQTQESFHFTLLEEIFPLDEKWLQPNGGYDLDSAACELLPMLAPHAPLTLVTKLRYTDLEHREEEDWFYFWDVAHERNEKISIVSTYLWGSMEPKRPLESYILLFLATITLERLTGLQFHTDTRGCLMDYCDNPSDIDGVLRSASFCDECQRRIERKVRSGQVSSVQVADSKRLLNRAAGRRCAFLAFPFKPLFWEIYQTILDPVLREARWTPITAITQQPRDITDAILRGIRESDLMVADVTGKNPNVYWEFGFAFALGKDYLLLSQNRRLPFDVSKQRCIFYEPGENGLKLLAQSLRDHLV